MACCRRVSPARRISAPLGSTHRTSRSRQTALTIADRTGCIAWAVEGLLPTLADAAFAVGNDVTLSDVRRRLEHDATHLAHPIGAAWVIVIDGAYALREDRIADAMLLLQRAVATREALPDRTTRPARGCGWPARSSSRAHSPKPNTRSAKRCRCSCVWARVRHRAARCAVTRQQGDGARPSITARTAGTRLANIFDKLDVRDRMALGDQAREQGLHRAT